MRQSSMEDYVTYVPRPSGVASREDALDLWGRVGHSEKTWEWSELLGWDLSPNLMSGE